MIFSIYLIFSENRQHFSLSEISQHFLHFDVLGTCMTSNCVTLRVCYYSTIIVLYVVRLSYSGTPNSFGTIKLLSTLIVLSHAPQLLAEVPSWEVWVDLSHIAHGTVARKNQKCFFLQIHGMPFGLAELPRVEHFSQPISALHSNIEVPKVEYFCQKIIKVPKYSSVKPSKSTANWNLSN